MTKPQAQERQYTLECSNGHTRVLGPSELEDLIRSGEHDCEECDELLNFDSPSSLSLECQICDDVFNVSSLREAQDTIDLGCQACERREFNEDSIHVRDSWEYFEDAYEWMRSGKDGSDLIRPDRTDYWEGVIHFCTAAEFVSIYRDGRIKAFPTGYFKLPAVCLSEATEGGWRELQSRHGPFGYVFRKRDIIAAGGGPALYMSPGLIKAQAATGFTPSVKPFVNLLRIRTASPNHSKWDYLHEREWRTPADIDFKSIAPFAVISGEFGRATPGWREVFHALMQYEELYVPAEPTKP